MYGAAGCPDDQARLKSHLRKFRFRVRGPESDFAQCVTNHPVEIGFDCRERGSEIFPFRKIAVTDDRAVLRHPHSGLPECRYASHGRHIGHREDAGRTQAARKGILHGGIGAAVMDVTVDQVEFLSGIFQRQAAAESAPTAIGEPGVAEENDPPPSLIEQVCDGEPGSFNFIAAHGVDRQAADAGVEKEDFQSR